MNKSEARERAERLGYYIEQDLTQDDAWITRDLYTRTRVASKYKSFDQVTKWIEREEKRKA